MSNKSASNLRLKLSCKVSSIPDIHPCSTRVSKNQSCFDKASFLTPKSCKKSIILKDACSYFPDWLLNRKDFQKFLSDEESCPDEFLTAALKPDDKRTANDLYFIINWFKKCRTTKDLKEFTLIKLAKSLEVFDVEKGSWIGDLEIGRNLVMVVQGTLGIYKENKKIGILGPRMAIHSNASFAKNDDIKVFKAMTDLVLVKINGEDVNQLLFSRDPKSSLKSFRLLKMQKYFSHIPDSKLQIFSENLLKLKYRKNEEIYEESSNCNYFFLIKSGRVHLQKNLTLTNKHNLPIRQILVSKKNYNYTVFSLSPGDMFALEESTNSQNYSFTAISLASSTIFAYPKHLLFEVLTQKELQSILQQFECNPPSREIKKRLKFSISSNLQRIRTMIETTERSDISTTRRSQKKRTWASGVSDYSSQVLPKMVSEQIEFQEKASYSSKRGLKLPFK